MKQEISEYEMLFFEDERHKGQVFDDEFVVSKCN